MKIPQRPFQYVAERKTGERLRCDAAELSALAAKYGTPLYVYSADFIRARYKAFELAFRKVPHTVCYSVKANSNLTILRLLARMKSGFDVVSGGELERVLRADRSAAKRVVFSGVGKTTAEIDLGLKSGILIFNVESESELSMLAERAAVVRKKARMALRVNPDVFAETHPYISTGLREHKFGVPIQSAWELYAQAAQSKWLDVAGVSVHIGSQIMSVEPFSSAMQRVGELVQQLRQAGHDLRYVDAGGGLGISYKGEADQDFPARVSAYAQALLAGLGDLKIHLLLEPGRAIIGPAGALLTRVLYVKKNGNKRFIVTDAAMNDLLRPSLYNAHHEIVPVDRRPDTPAGVFDVVGPVCETGDFFARDRELPEVAEGDLLAILDAGAYGIALSSNYNTRPRPAEVLVDGRSAKLIRKRETLADLVRQEV
ncbi:MAG: diaminopimelate decarboxylase [Acidobacteria bacterium]|nr:diaminopimelate decarboxylase [Acidobacteriota bacterium]